MNKLVIRKAVYNFEGELIELDGYFYSGPVALCGGPSAQQQEIAAQQQQFYSTMQQDYSTTFAEQQSILGSLNASFQPILAAGINQYGFNKAEDTALRSAATDQTGASYQAATKALNENIAARGGTGFIPSGESAQLNAQNTTAAAQQEASQNLGITEAGYQQGRNDYLAAASALGGVASAYNPAQYASTANTSGQDAFGSATTNYQEGNQWEGILGGALGAAAQVGLGVATGGASLAFGGLPTGAISGMFGGPASVGLESNPGYTGNGETL